MGCCGLWSSSAHVFCALEHELDVFGRIHCADRPDFMLHPFFNEAQRWAEGLRMSRLAGVVLRHSELQ